MNTQYPRLSHYMSQGIVLANGFKRYLRLSMGQHHAFAPGAPRLNLTGCNQERF